jgi:hypothetical protein
MAHFLDRWVKRQLISCLVIAQDQNNVACTLKTEFLVLRTDFRVAMVVWHSEGLKGAFAIKGLLSHNQILKVVSKEVRTAYLDECRDWAKKYGD